jgi:UDP-glucose:(heptosyl)LPS alpha-1,3-glucosyltransferase
MDIIIAKKDMRNIKTAVPAMVLEEAGYFTKRGHRVRIITEIMGKKAILQYGAEPVKTFQWPISGYFRRKFYQFLTKRYIKKTSTDLVIGHGDIVDQNILFMHNCMHLAHERIYGEPIPTDSEVGRIHEEIITKGKFDVLVCNSVMMQEDFIKRFNVNPAKTVIICPGVDMSKLDATDEERDELGKETRKNLGIPEQASVIGLITSGGFAKRNVEGMLRAFAIIADKFPSAWLLVAGKDRSKPYKALAEELHIADRVVFAPAIAEVKQYYFALDIFALPAHIEEFGRSIAEAMYCKLPVIVSPWAGAADILEGESRNYILPDLNPESIAGSLEILLNNPTTWERLGALNHAVAAKYTKEASMEKLYALAENLVSS